MTCVALFTIARCCAVSRPVLAGWCFSACCRVLGGGGLQPSEQAILADTFPPAKRGMAFAVYGMARGAAPAIWARRWADGSRTTLRWRWIFFINVPVGILSLFLTSTVDLTTRRTSSDQETDR